MDGSSGFGLIGLAMQWRIHDLDLWCQVERKRRKNRGCGAENIWEWGMGKVVFVPIGEGYGGHNFFFIFGFEMRILVHSPAHLSICLCTLIQSTSRSKPL